MNNIHSELFKADQVLEEFARKNDKFKSRFTALLKDMNEFIDKAGLDEKVTVNEMVLGYMLVDYFEDILRLKNFHGIDHINSVKIVAYTSYWFLRRKPIQVLEQDKKLIYINERFILAYIMDFISGNEKVSLLSRENKGLKSFSESLFYFLKYRFREANSLEMVLTAFFAGQIYQEKDKDLSDCVGNAYN